MKGIKLILCWIGFMAWALPMAAWNQTPAGTVISNTAIVSYDGGAGVVLTMPSNTVLTEVLPGDLLVTKSADRTEVETGDTLIFGIELRNTGAFALLDVTVRDTLPPMLSLLDSDPDGTLNGNTVVWQIDRLEPGESRILQLTCLVLKTAYRKNIINQAIYTVNGRTYGSNRVIVHWNPWPEVVFTKTVAPVQVYSGDTLTYVLNLRNTGPMTLSQVTVRDTLPSSIQFIDATRSVTLNGQIVIWTIGTLNPGDNRSLSIRGLVLNSASGPLIRNGARVGSAEGIRYRAEASAAYLGQGAGLVIEKQTEHAVYRAGDTLTYDLILTNSGVRTGRQVIVRDTLPSTLSYVGSTHGGSHENQIVIWNLGDLSAGYHDTLRVTAAIRVPTADYTTVNNEVWARTETGIRDSSSWKILIRSKSGAGFGKTVDKTQCFIGDTLTYHVQVRNTGTTNLGQIVVRDTLPEGILLISADHPANAANGVLTWILPSLDYQGTQTLTFTARVDHPAGKEFMNTAWMECQDSIRYSASVTTDFGGHGVGIDIKKEAPNTLYPAGDVFTYDLIITNGGLRTGHAVTVCDTLPGELLYLGSTHEGKNENNIVTWHIDDFESGYHDTLHVTVGIRVPIEDRTLVNNEVWAYAAGAEDSSNWRIVVTSKPDLTLEILGPAVASPGDTITYMLVYSNQGTATAFEPVLRDTLPEFLDYISASGEHGYISSADAVHWFLPPLNPGDSDTLYLSARIHDDATSEDEIVNSAWLSYKKATRVAIATCVTKTVPQGKTLYAYKTVNRETASEGDTLIYSIYFGSLNRDVEDTLYISDNLPAEVEWVPDAILPKSLPKSISYDPVLHCISLAEKGLAVNQMDSVRFMTVVKSPLSPGVQQIENQAFLYITGDSVYTENDPRTHSVTRLVKPFLSVKKTVNRKNTEKGDVLTYTVTVENKSLITPLTSLNIQDLLPEGFRYQEGTSMLDSVKIQDPGLGHSGKRVLIQWTLNDTLNPGELIRLKYRTLIGLDARPGDHENLAGASGLTPDGIRIFSEETAVSVLVRYGAFDEKGFIFGKVYEDLNRNTLHDSGEPQFKGVELIMEDGTRVKTDAFGKYSIPDVEYGQHVLRLNETTLPGDKHVLDIDFEFLGDPKSRLVIVPPGGMAKANFAVESVK